MSADVHWSKQVSDFASAMAPDPKKKVRAAIRGLANDKGDIKDLVGELLGYKRLRVGTFRVIYRDGFENGRPVRKCIFAERRNVVYEIFARMIMDDVS